MSGKKGMKKYSQVVRETILKELKEGKSQRALSLKYGISRWAIQSWNKEAGIPKQRGRKPAKTLQEYKYENKRLRMEVELLRDFLSLIGKE
jgi:transposase-like protein